MRIRTHLVAGSLVSAIQRANWSGEEEGSERKMDEHSTRMSSELRTALTTPNVARGGDEAAMSRPLQNDADSTGITAHPEIDIRKKYWKLPTIRTGLNPTVATTLLTRARGTSD